MKRIVSLVLVLVLILSVLTGLAGATQTELTTTSGGLTYLRMPGSMSFDFKLNGEVVDAARITDIQLDSKLGVIKQVESQWGQFQIDVGSAYPEKEGMLSLKIDGIEHTMTVSTAKADFGFYTSSDFGPDSYLVPDGMQSVFFESGSEQKIWFQFTRDNKIASVSSSNALMSGSFNEAQVACFTVDPDFKGSFETRLTVTDEDGETFRIFLSVANVKVTTTPGGRVDRDTQVKAILTGNGISAPFKIDGYEGEFYMGIGTPDGTQPGNQGTVEQPMRPDEIHPKTTRILFYKSIGDRVYERVTEEEERAILDAFGGTLSQKLYALDGQKWELDEPEFYPTLHEVDDEVCTITADMTVSTFGSWMYQAKGTLYTGTENETAVEVNSRFDWYPRSTVLEYFPKATMPTEILDEINAFLQTYVEQEDVQQIVIIPAGAYTGSIILGNDGMGLQIVGDGEVTLYGGVINNSGELPGIEYIHFVGAGSDKKEWDNEALKGMPNIAVRGTGGGIVSHCTFTGYDYALYTERVTASHQCEYVNNNVAIMEDNWGGGSPLLSYNKFKNNNIALDFENMEKNNPTTFFDISKNQFIDNKWDVRNKLKRTLYLPGNFFGETVGEDVVARPCNAQVKHGSTVTSLMDETPDEDNLEYAEQIHAYPRYADTGFNAWVKESEAVVSVAQTADFRIPQANLSGTAITVMDAEEELATLVFPDSGSIVSLFSENADSFDATVSVEENDDGSMTFTMNDPLGMNPTVRIPAARGGVTVTDPNGEALAVTEENGYLCFIATTGGSYTINSTTAAKLDASGTLRVELEITEELEEKGVEQAALAIYNQAGQLVALALHDDLDKPLEFASDKYDLTQCDIKVMLLSDDSAPLCGAAFLKASKSE